MSGQSRIDDIEVVHRGKWLQTEHIKYSDPNGKVRYWEALSYVSRPSKPDVPDSVAIVSILKRNLHHNCFVLVKQFRPPLGCFCIEFPAGLCDNKDSDIHATALRELYEETGYTGMIADETEHCLSTSLDPGTEKSTIAFVNVIIDGDDPKNIDCKQHLDEGEFIEVLLLPVRGLLHRLKQISANSSGGNIVIDSRLYSFAKGLEMGDALNSKLKVGDNCEGE